MEIDSREPPVVVAVVGEAATLPRRDQQVLGTVAIHVVPGDPGPELAQGLGQQGLAVPVVERSLDVAVAEL